MIDLKAEKPNKEEFPIPYTEEQAAVINNYFGIPQTNTLDNSNCPKRIALTRLCQDTQPVIARHPQDRELYIGMDVKDGLQIVEVVEGLTRDEIPNENPEGHSFGEVFLGRVKHKAHTLNFHTHPLLPFREIPKNRHKGVLSRYPKAYFQDLGWFALYPNTYVNVVCDTSDKRGLRFMIAFKTANSWKPTKNNYISFNRKFEDIYMSELLGGNYDNIRSLLEWDKEWMATTGMMIYRGLISDQKEGSFAMRSDLILSRLMAVRKKKFFLFS